MFVPSLLARSPRGMPAAYPLSKVSKTFSISFLVGKKKKPHTHIKRKIHLSQSSFHLLNSFALAL